MKKSNKLRNILFLLVITPTLLVAILSFLIISLNSNAVANKYEVNSRNPLMLVDWIDTMSDNTDDLYQQLNKVSNENPEQLENKEFLNSINEQLEKKYSYLVCRLYGEYYYFGENRDNKFLESNLPRYGSQLNVNGGFYVKEGTHAYYVKTIDFMVKDGRLGTVFILTKMDTRTIHLKNIVYQLFASRIIITILTAIVALFCIYKYVLNPVRKLNEASSRIAEGDFEHKIKSQTDDEIGELYLGYERMRKNIRESQLERLQSEKILREVMGNISHDLKTPLTAIKGYAEGILDGVASTPEKMDKYIHTIYSKAVDMTVLVEELSFYTKIDGEAIPYHFMSVKLNDYFSDCISELTLDLEMKNINLIFFNYTDINQKVLIDLEQLKRVINNIVGNAVKYIGRKSGKISIVISEEEELVQVCIKDNGKGIEKKDLPFIFDRFYRTDASRNSSMGGSGLGLAIAKKIIEDHGGRIWAESEVDVGTAIYFTLKKTMD